LGEEVCVIERNPENQFLEDIRRDGSPLFVGDARRGAYLADANVATAKSIILVTNHDLTNLETALDASRINPQIRVILRIFDQNMADKIREGFNIQGATERPAIAACELHGRYGLRAAGRYMSARLIRAALDVVNQLLNVRASRDQLLRP
jgi:hypothetical protein